MDANEIWRDEIMAKPILKWAGGKRQLLPEILERAPKEIGTYYEPFFGGGAVFFALEEKYGQIRAVLNDKNENLISFYRELILNPTALYDQVQALDDLLSEAEDPGEFYKQVRTDFNRNRTSPRPDTVLSKIWKAAAFLFLNKHCFNGLYRVNAHGMFNVPWNKKTVPSIEREDLFASAKALTNAVLSCADWRTAVGHAGKGDFVFFDPPYVPSQKGGFTSYTSDGFGEEEHVRLAEGFRTLSGKGAFCMLTNHDTPLIRELYDGFLIERVDVKRNINSKGDSRKGVEVIIRNYA